MTVKLSPIGNDAPFLDASGIPLNAGQLFTYLAGSVSTSQTTYTDSAGTVPNANPIVLNSNGYPASGGNVVEIWLTSGVAYKFVLKTSAGVTVWSRDNISGVNDATLTIDQWVSGAAPTYVSATSFTLAGDQTSIYHVGRRLKTTNSGGTIYSTITASAFGAVTTITVANDSGTLDSGLSAVSYSIVSAINPSIDADMVNRKGTAVVSAATTDIWTIAGDYVHVTGSTGPITSLGTAPYAGAQRTVIFDSTPTITHNATSLILPGGISIVAAANDRMIVRADTTANMMVVQYTRATEGPKLPTRQVLTSGSGATYTTPAGATRIDVWMVGGGGGGSVGGTAFAAGNVGGDTTFGTLTAQGASASATPGNTPTNTATATNGDINISGGAAAGTNGTASNASGTNGASSPLGGGGAGGANSAGDGGAAKTNTGSGGGGGASSGAGGAAASGGGHGAWLKKLIVGPAATYTYTVGAGGAGKTAPANGTASGAGASGIIIVDEWYD